MQRLYNGFSILLASVCLVIFVVLSAQASEIPTVSLKLTKEWPAPKFEYLDDINENHTLDYESHTLTAVHFWATWCVPCIDELPQVDAAQEIFRNPKWFGADGFKVVAIAIDGRNMSKVKRFFADKRIKNLDAALDPTQNMPKLAKLSGLPGTVFVSKRGEIVARADGPLDWESPEVQKFFKAQLAASK